MNKYYKVNKDKGYFIKIDISKYFDSINHNILKDKLSKYIYNKDILCFVNYIIDSYEKTKNKGLPMGNQTSQIFALLYLNDLDHYIKEILNIKYYIRYMDDMIILVNNKELARFYLNCIKNYISSEDLIVNPKS